MQDIKSVDKSLLHFYTINELAKSLYHCIPSNKISRKNLTKEVKDLFTEFCKILMKDNEEDTNKWKDIFYAHVLKESILLKCLYYPK